METRRSLGILAAIASLGAEEKIAIFPSKGLMPRKGCIRGPIIGHMIHTKPGRRGGERQKYFVPLYAEVIIDRSRYTGSLLRKIRADGDHR